MKGTESKNWISGLGESDLLSWDRETPRRNLYICSETFGL